MRQTGRPHSEWKWKPSDKLKRGALEKQDQQKIESKRIKIITMQTLGPQSSVSILISDSKTWYISEEKGGHFITIKKIIQTGKITFSNTYAPQNTASKYLKQKRKELKEKQIQKS